MPFQHRLQFALRGAEFAFAIPKDDFSAFVEVAACCCDFWNGANSLIISVGSDGELPGLDPFLAVRDVERVYVHERVDEKGRKALHDRYGSDFVTNFLVEALHHELHPLNLQPSFREQQAGEPRVALPIPFYEDPDLVQLSQIVFGRIGEEDREEYARAFLLEEHRGDAAHFALVDAQVTGLAPLAQSTYLINAHRRSSPIDVRHLTILDGKDFGDLVYFWNLRSRTTRFGGGPTAIGVPIHALQFPERLSPLKKWTESAFGTVKPDLLVKVDPGARDQVVSALEDLGYSRTEDDSHITQYWGAIPEERRQLEYGFTTSGWIGGQMRRGVTSEQLVALEAGRNVVRFEPPKEFETKFSGGGIRLDLLNWPLHFKPTAETAKRVHEVAYVDQGCVCLRTAASNGPLTFDLVVPGADDALSDFLTERGLEARLSAAGRYAQALIGRLGGPQRLEEMAKPEALHVLEQLTSLSRRKLVQRLDSKLTERYREYAPPSEELEEIIRGQVIALELPAPSLDDLASQTRRQRADLVRALEPLVDVGFVRRGRFERCPECGYSDFYPLLELDERVHCHACQQGFLIKVSAGPDEPRLSYQLDPLMARAMDQDLLPVLLTLRHLYSPEGASAGAFWPGLEIIEASDGTVQDCDILLAQDGDVIVCECKRSAAGLSIGQAESVLTLADRLDARAIFAALDGEFSNEVQSLANRSPISLIGRAQLVSDEG